ncbi:metal-dependent hydrolase [Sphingomonas sp. Leaf357]|uniref:cyclase family protein n=1 Tax=Sphingomonas sp. Leaf357 TaxID=1736350 RepID=UPI0006F748CD|nr:cyclase family protein [Sphingomonas sp. Leaf357]KQS03677.1 metal-dependent hydrolase [Sphingomonas sp. Leaf357]
MTQDVQPPSVADLTRDAPKNWGKWGPDDEVGSLNYLGPTEVLRGVAAVRQGRTFTLQVQIGAPGGDPIWPGRAQCTHVNLLDKGDYACGKGVEVPGHAEAADDMLIMYLQGSTQYDALGHVWCEDQLWNGYDAKTTARRMTKASVLPIAERGVVGRAVLIDIARHRGKRVLDRGETFDHTDLLAAAAVQGVDIEKRDILIIRTGWIGAFYEMGAAEFYRDFREPGLTYSRSLAQWFAEMEIPNLVTDTMANETTVDPVSGVMLPLHIALMRNLGVAFTEIAQLDALADDCAADGQYTFLYAAAPLKVVGGTGAPVNPIVVK